MNRVQLTRELIVTAAVDILDTYGLNDMTMRRVATQLSVAPGALYWHVSNKQELIHAIAAHILAPVTGPPGTAGTRAYCRTLRARLLRHRDGAELIASALAQPEATLRTQLETNLTQLLVSEGHDNDSSATAARALLHLLLGASVQQQMREQFAATLGSSPDGPDVPTGADTPDDVEDQIDLILRGL